MKLLSTLFALLLGLSVLQAQTSKDATIPITASFTVGPASVTLNWQNPGGAGLLILRRTKGQGGTAWQQLINMSSSNMTTLTDVNVTAGQIYEYVIQRTINNINAFGYAHVALNANPVNSRGKILIFVDSTTADALGVELVRMKNDMRGDGWWPIPFHTGPSSTVQSIKDQIRTSYNADPANVKAVLLLGTVPVPYSGDQAWDGHVPDHKGAWPADSYYAELNGNWTDTLVNNTVPNRAANHNVPGDGKFDQNYIPTAVELQVGRVDFRHIDAAAFGAADQIELMRRYLDKNHNWRIGNYEVENKALVDDNFGYFGGEAFAANGYRNAYPLVGESNIVEADFFENTNPQSYLLGFGCGGGNYNGAGGVGSSSNFATDTVNIVFSNLFGSYFGDWDYESNPFMPSALASRGGILTCSWAGRPHWFNQALASGETIGYCNRETMNAQFNNGFLGSFGESGAHIALLGDPTLRAHVVKPATNLIVSSPDCQGVNLSWTASADSVAGYHIYRAPSQDGPYTRLTTNLVTGLSYVDMNPAEDTFFYQVRAIQNVSSPGGGTYANNAIGPIKSIIFNLPPVVQASASGALNCTNTSVELSSGNTHAAATYAWSGPNGFSSTLANPTVSVPGIYTVVVTVGNCSKSGVVEVFQAPPLIVAGEPTISNCDGTISTCVTIGGGTAPYSILWSNGTTTNCATYAGGQTLSVKVTDAGGCVFQSQPVIIQVPAPINVNIAYTFSCVGPTLACASVTGGQVPYTYAWSNGNNTSCATFTSPGVYGLTVTDATGCTKASNLVVIDPAAIVSTVTVTNETAPNASNGTIDLTVNGGQPGYTYVWNTGATTQDLTALTSGTYTVTITDANGCTSTASATVMTTVDAQEVALFEQFQLSPNPTEGQALLQLKLRKSANLRVEIRDMAGRLIQVNPTQQTDALSLPIDLTQSPVGTYSIAVWVENQVFVRRLSVVR